MAEQMLKAASERDSARDDTALSPSLSLPWEFYGVGDNPLSDIRGANNADRPGSRWRSVLVRTGVWGAIGAEGERASNDETDPASLVCNDVVHVIRTLGLK